MRTLRPCARCEEELPESAFESPKAAYCRHCAHEMDEMVRTRYHIIETAYFRAQLRRKTRDLKVRRKAEV